MTDSARFQRAIQSFDSANSKDPNIELAQGKSWPREVLYAVRLSEWVLRLAPGASEHLRLAARAQHLCRWEIPRNSYPMDKPGYLRWRNDLKKFHAKKAGQILAESEFTEAEIEKVLNLILKKNFPADPESRVIEDALCLVFLEYQLADLASRTSDEKVVNALRKSWKKMTEQARQAALKLNYGPKELALIQQALKEPVAPL
jgi:hypothetical protein